MALEATKRTNMRRVSPKSILSLLLGSKEPPMARQPAMGFFTDTSLCIGCKACEIACKQWNQLPASDPQWTG
ncbi:MAG TPA: 4Fe-4S binding protein, partial [Ktedonobacteraceae bacterium]|nr:4Fe-4S binding protein [Ktedonobacteraceae bacterium]